MQDISEKQLKSYIESNSRINVWEGSVRSGKSFIALYRFVKEIKYGPKGAMIICGRSETTVIRNVIEPLRVITGNAVRYKQGLREFELFGRKVYVVGANDERAEGKIRGATFAGALVDEATLLPETFFRMLLSRLSIDGAKVFITTNPDSPYHWLKQNFLDRTDELDLSVFKFRLEDNPSLSASFINNLKKEYRGLWYKRFIEGEWVLAEGAIYDFFDTSYHTVKEPPTYAKQYYLGIDYGTTNPFAAVLVGYNDDHHPSLWVEKEYLWDSSKQGYQKTDSEYADDIQKAFEGYPVRLIYLDPSAESFQVELRRRNKPVKQANNEVLNGIRFCANLITQGDITICRSCPNLIREIEGYVWDSKAAKDGIDKPLKKNDHLVDAFRYVCYSHFGQKTTLKAAPPKNTGINPMNYPGWGPDSHGWQAAGF